MPQRTSRHVIPERLVQAAPSPARLFRQVPPSVRLRIGPPRPPSGGPIEGALTYASWATPRSGREVRVTLDAQGAYWLFEAAIGEVRLSGELGLIEAWPSPTVHPRRFMETLFLEWLPPIYTQFGWSVLEASSVWRIGSSSAVAFAGDRGSGKSTLARSIGMRPGWGQLADSSLAFDMLGTIPELLAMPNRTDLSPPASVRLEYDPTRPIDLEWPNPVPRLEAIYLLQDSGVPASRAEIRPVGLNEAYDALYESAKRLALPDAEIHDAVSRSLRELVASVRVFSLTYSRNISQLRSLTNGVSQHALGVIHQAESLRARAAELAARRGASPAASEVLRPRLW